MAPRPPPKGGELADGHLRPERVWHPRHRRVAVIQLVHAAAGPSRPLPRVRSGGFVGPFSRVGRNFHGSPPWPPGATLAVQGCAPHPVVPPGRGCHCKRRTVLFRELVTAMIAARAGQFATTTWPTGPSRRSEAALRITPGGGPPIGRGVRRDLSEELREPLAPVSGAFRAELREPTPSIGTASDGTAQLAASL